MRSPSTLGTFLRGFRFGHVRQLDAVAARFLAGLARRSPLITAAELVTYIDIDDTMRATFGRSVLYSEVLQLKLCVRMMHQVHRSAPTRNWDHSQAAAWSSTLSSSVGDR